MTDGEIEVETPDGPMTVFQSGPSEAGGGLLVYMDVFGLRDELFDMCRAFAAQGLAVFCPDLFHRLPRSRFTPINGKEDQLPPDVVAANDRTTMAQTAADTAALIAYNDAELARLDRKFVAVGYCMGGRHALSAASRMPGRVRAYASVHGGRLVSADENSPHRLAARCTSEAYYAIAKDDPTCPAEHAKMVRSAVAQSPGGGSCEDFDAYHGWSFPGRWSYDPAAVEVVNRRIMELCRRNLAA